MKLRRDVLQINETKLYARNTSLGPKPFNLNPSKTARYFADVTSWTYIYNEGHGNILEVMEDVPLR